MADTKYRVAIIGCGRLGQKYAEAYSDFPETEIVALAEYNPERRKAVGERFGVKALYADAESLLRDVVPDVAAVVTPTKYYKDAVIACAEAGVKGVSCDKPIAAVLADADEMVRVCEERGVVFAGGNLQRAISEVRETGQRLHSGALGTVEGVALHSWGTQISGGGCQHISVLRLWTGAEVDEVIAWGTPQEALESGCDDGLLVHGRFRLSNGMDCPVYGIRILRTGAWRYGRTGPWCGGTGVSRRYSTGTTARARGCAWSHSSRTTPGGSTTTWARRYGRS